MAELADKRYIKISIQKEDKMIIKGCKTIAEYAFRRWMAHNGFMDGYFTLEVEGNKGVITDKTGDTLHLIYNSVENRVEADK